MTKEQLDSGISIQREIKSIGQEIENMSDEYGGASPAGTNIPQEIYDTFKRDSLAALNRRLVWLEEEFAKI